MAVIPSIKLRHKRNGAIRIVNQTFYSDHLGKWADWEIVSMRGGEVSDKMVAFERDQERIELARIANPKSPAHGDAQRAYEQRTVTVNTAAPAPDPTAVEYTQAIGLASEPAEMPKEREVPVIGGSQTVKISGKKPPGRPRNASQDEVL